MTEAARREEAFRSALQRLPMAVVIVDGARRIVPYNNRATELFESEGLRGDLVEHRPQHPLSVLISEILSDRATPSDRTVSFPSGRCFRIEPSRRSEKGMNRWLMLLVSPVTEAISIDSFDLTPRQRAVAEELMSGATSEEICATLSISRETLKSHMSHLFESTATRNRAELVARLLKR